MKGTSLVASAFRSATLVAYAIALPAGLFASGCQKTGERATEPAEVATSTASTPPTGTAQPPQPAPEPNRPPPPPLPDPLPGARTDLTTAAGTASRGAIADLDGDGTRELVVVDAKQLRVLDATGRQLAAAPVAGGIQVLVATDLDGDERAEIYAGWGQTRDHMDAKARITVHRFERGKLVEEPVLVPETTRQEIVALVPMPDTSSLLVAYFDSKYMVTTNVLARTARGWTATKLAQLRTATSYARGDIDGDRKPDLVVGRVYGDDRGVDGDAFVLAPDGSRTLLPSTRGLRSLALADTDGDGTLEVFMGDGWHQNYGKLARGRLTWVRHTKDGFRSELVEDTPGQFELMRIVPATIDGKPALVTLGSHYVRVFVRDGEHWHGHTIAGTSRDIAVGDVDGTPGDEILVIGETSELVDLRGALTR